MTNKIETVTTYRVDGVDFATPAEAEAHLAEESVRADAMKYAIERLEGADGERPAVRTVTRIVNVVVAWEAWKATHDVPDLDDE